MEIRELEERRPGLGERANRKDEFCPKSGPSTFALPKDPLKVWLMGTRSGGGRKWKGKRAGGKHHPGIPMLLAS